MTCASCYRRIERPNYIHGIPLCGTCALERDQEMPQIKRLSHDWRDFTQAKRRRNRWH